MTQEHGWKKFFKEHAPEYMDNCFTSATIEEVDFIEEELKLEPGAKILDVGCGTGRHSLELSRRGYQVTGLDLSEEMLAEGREIANEEGLEVEFIQANAVDFHLETKYDGAICLCEGAFGLLSMGDDPLTRDLQILKNIQAVLKPGAQFILTALNGLRKARSYSQEDVESGKFDPHTLVETMPLQELLPDADPEVMIQQKGFVGSELVHMLKASGFQVENMWGGTAGCWNREKLNLDEMELMVISRKKNT
ncbi:MAG: class I SAM-dependent methyltransferase [Bacillota bacterium]